jgi:hypothetical protein
LRRALCLTFGLSAVAFAMGLADASMAQTAPTTAPPRYLNWAGRTEATPAPVAVSAQPGAGPRRPNRVIPHGGAYPAPAPVAPAEAPRRTLTPANAWLRPAPLPTPAPAPAPMAAAPAPVAPQPTPPGRTASDFLPEQGGRGQPVPAEVALAASQPAAPPASADPMAPRRDAPIFRMQQPAPVVQPANSGTEQGVRRYSVHRLNGQEPDALSMPAPTTVDVVTVGLDQTIASQDLAQPAPGPTLIRDAQGRVRAQPAAPEGDYQ